MKLKRNKYDLFTETVCLTLMIGILLYLLLNWASFPNKIPGHYNASGVADRMGNKSELLVTPIIGWLLYLGMTAVEQFPELWNTGVKVTEENKERIYRVLKDMLNTLKLLMVIVFTFITIISSKAMSLPAWFLPVFLFVMFASIIFFIIKLAHGK